jgi:hypothetical protein
MGEIDLSEELQDFYEKNKHEKSIRNWEETLKKSKGFLSSNFLKFNVIGNGINPESKIVFTSINSNDEFIFSFRQDVILVYKTYFLFRGSSIYNNQIFYKINYSNYGDVEIDYKKTLGKEYPILKCKKQDFYSDSMIQDDHLRLFNEFDFIIKKRLKEEENIKEDKLKEQERLKEEQRKKQEEQKRQKYLNEKEKKSEEKRLKNLERKKILQEGITKFIKEFDSDKDGIIDFNQGGDDFMNLLKKHQKTIIQVDQNHITKLIQVSNYLKTKRGNIQTQFEKIKNSRNSKQLNEFTGILKNQIDTFNLLNYNSLIMIISLVEGDLITFNEIYLTFDKLNIFNSNWENQVSDNLNNIDSKLDEVIYSINKMELSIVNEILGMSIMNQVQMNRLNKNVKEGNMMIDENLSRLNSSLSSNLKSINSTIKVGNLISTINTYQNYKTNRRLNS